MVPKGHHEIAKVCVPVLKDGRPNDDYAYFYFGNWFTDVSQSVAPVDYAAAMISVFQQGRMSTWAPNFLADPEIDKYVKGLLGDPPPNGSNLAAYFRDLIYVFGWTEFCRDPRRVTDGYIPFAEYDRIFQNRFTQYFPHEHLDRWPMERTGKSRFGRRIYDYLERDLIYVSELLTLVERDWAKVRSNPASKDDQKRHDLLVEFGHAVHATEDFFAHSNFVEFAVRSLDPARFSGSPDNKRRFDYRLMREKNPRTDTYDQRGEAIPPGAAEPETDVVTGYFDSLDTRFSLDGLFAHVKERLKQLPAGPEGQVVDLLDYRLLPFRSLDRTRLQHYRDAKKDEYSRLHDRVLMPQKVRDAHFRFIDLDWAMMDKWDGMGVSKALEMMIQDGENFTSKTFPPPDGTQYKDRYGSHTLLAKDDPTKIPGYTEAMNLAKRLGKYIAKVMVRDERGRKVRAARTPDGKDPNKNKIVIPTWVDWLELLQYFCGHPDEAVKIGEKGSKFWWTEALDNESFVDTGHQIRYIDKGTVDQRAELKNRGRAEAEHNSMIQIEVNKYNATKAVTRKSITDSAGIKAGEQKTYEQLDVDAGGVRVTCQQGSIRIETSFISMGSSGPSNPLENAVIDADGAWGGNFPHYQAGGQDSRYFQTNQTIITGIAPQSTYQIQMAGWASI